MNWRKRPCWVPAAMIGAFTLMNVVAFFHAYKFTHFVNGELVKTKDARQLSITAKIRALFLGIDNPRPVNKVVPAGPFETVRLHSNKEIECWRIKTKSALVKGTVVLFHGYSGQKSSLLDKAEEFRQMGYNTMLVDFMGSGGSEGNQTTIGFHEAEEVKTCVDYLRREGEHPIYLFGTSMGAVAILKAINDHGVEPSAIIIECPFGSMYQTTCARFRSMHVPAFPMAALLDFWGGVQNNFWAFGHNPAEYAKAVDCPVLLLYGEQDEKVSRQEIDEIYTNLSGVKQLKTYPRAGHENYLRRYRQQWTQDVHAFLTRQENAVGKE